MPYSTSFAFDSVIVIESLRDSGRRTGHELFTKTLQPLGAHYGVGAEFHGVNTRRDLSTALASVVDAARMGRAPIVHLEMHGAESGLELASGEVAEWSDMVSPLQEANQLTKMNLLVFAASCHGWHMSDILRPIDRSPAWAILGPPDRVSAGSVFDAAADFYSALFSGQDLDSALRAMNATSAIPDWDYRLQIADLLFCLVFRTYLDLFSTEESREDRVSRLVVEFAREHSMDVLETAKFRQLAREQMNDDQFWYQRYKERFLYLDMFPQNSARFGIDFTNCAQMSRVA